ncbi:hypothetical protein Scep_023614 [Stephania cephalantha]|uniref:Uncharacterized protein n=1 Tax=Stephania cephalantha TaxID=152367 RepID=A0AAP0HXK3_9MAGN
MESSSSGGGGGFRARMEYFMFSGDKKHVLIGIGIVSAIFAVPWFLMTGGTKHRSHQDYMEKADKARSERLSSSASTT